MKKLVIGEVVVFTCKFEIIELLPEVFCQDHCFRQHCSRPGRRRIAFEFHASMGVFAFWPVVFIFVLVVLLKYVILFYSYFRIVFIRKYTHT